MSLKRFDEQKPVASADANTQIAEMVKLITQIGPDIAEISRRLGIFKETVRYRYKSLLDKGFGVQASANYEKLGLKRYAAYLDFAEDFKPYAEAILTAMSQLCYLSSYEKTIPNGDYLMHAPVPVEYTQGWIEFMNSLTQKGLFKSIDLYNFDSARNVPMRSDLYNFESGTWDFEWSNTPQLHPNDVIYETARKEKFDDVDLKIIEQLQYDANKSFIEMHEKLNINYKTLTWHYRNHILGNGLLKGYKVNWMGTRYDFKLEKAMHRKHRYVYVDLFAKNLTPNERMTLMGKMNSVPFLWFEAVGQDYYAQMGLPTESITDGLSYLEETLAPVRERTRWSIADPAHALAFTIEPQLFDAEKKEWKFNTPELMERFENLFVHIRETETGGRAKVD